MVPAKTLHPLAMYSVIEQNIATNIYDSLISRNSDGKLIPGLATSWELIDETTWRFYLRKGVKWQDGGDFTADDVIFTFEDIGRTPINRYKFIMQKIKKVSKVDDFTVDIETNGPYAILADAFYHTIFRLLVVLCGFDFSRDQTHTKRQKDRETTCCFMGYPQSGYKGIFDNGCHLSFGRADLLEAIRGFLLWAASLSRPMPHSLS